MPFCGGVDRPPLRAASDGARPLTADESIFTDVEGLTARLSHCFDGLPLFVAQAQAQAGGLYAKTHW